MESYIVVGMEKSCEKINMKKIIRCWTVILILDLRVSILTHLEDYIAVQTRRGNVI